MCLSIILLMMQSSRLCGLRFRSYGLGYQVAKAREARLSIMRLTQSIWIGLSTSFCRRAAPIRVITTATTLIVSWNCINLRMESQIFLPQSTALTLELKLSSIRMMAAAYLATSVPLTPIAKPTSAFLKAGASFVPSPVTATTFPLSLRPVTRQYLS